MDLTNKDIKKENLEAAKVHPVKNRLLKFLKWLSKGQKGKILCKS
jgi:hypothetical protein